MHLPDDLLADAKIAAAREQITLRELVERGVRLALRRAPGARPFRLRDASVDGEGLQPEFQGAGWDAVRDAIYEPERR